MPQNQCFNLYRDVFYKRFKVISITVTKFRFTKTNYAHQEAMALHIQ